jgi:hypothetical protein
MCCARGSLLGYTVIDDNPGVCYAKLACGSVYQMTERPDLSQWRAGKELGLSPSESLSPDTTKKCILELVLYPFQSVFSNGDNQHLTPSFRNFFVGKV